MKKQNNTKPVQQGLYTQSESIDAEKAGPSVDISKLMAWSQSIASRPHLFFPSNEDHRQYHYFRIVLNLLKDFEAGSVRRKSFVQFSCILYNSHTTSYVGQTYFSEMFDYEANSEERPSLQCNKSVYLYTASANMNLKVDVWRLESEKNKSGFQLMVKRHFLGHFVVDLSQDRQSGKISTHLIKNEEQRFFNDGDSQENSENVSQPNHRQCTMTYQVLNTHSLSYLRHFLPDNVICDENDQILGLSHGCISREGEILSDERTKFRFEIQEVGIPRAMVKSLAESAIEKMRLSYDVVGKESFTLKEMMLHFEFHNGWKAVCQQVLPLKEREEQFAPMSKTKIDKSSQGKPKGSDWQGKYVYYFEKMKELNAVYLKPGGALIVWLQAKLQLKFDVVVEEERKTKNEKVLLPLGFFLACLEQKEEEKREVFQFWQGNPYNLSHLLQYLSQLCGSKQKASVGDSSQAYCQLMFYLIQSKDGMQSIDKDTAERDAQEIQSLKAEKDRLMRLRRKIKEEKRKRLIDINQEIPFLDPTNIKQELYTHKIEQLRNEKEEKETILRFLTTKVTQLEREALAEQYNSSQNMLSNDGSNLIQKMPSNFMDFKTEQKGVGLGEGLSIDVFSESFCKKAIKGAGSVTRAIVQAFMVANTYLKIEVTKFVSLREDIAQFTMLLYDFAGRKHSLGPISSNYQPEQHLSLLIPLPKDPFQIVSKLLNNLLNSLIPIYLQCQTHPKMVGLGLLNLDKLMESLEVGSIHSSFTVERAVVKQEETQLAEVEVVVGFSQSVGQVAEIEQNMSMMQRSELVVGERRSQASRINRYKQGAISDGISGKPVQAQLIEKALSSVPSKQIVLHYEQGTVEAIKLHIDNSSAQPKLLRVNIADDDQPFLSKPEITIDWVTLQQPNPNLSFQSSSLIQIEPNTTAVLPFTYHSPRKIMNLNSHLGSQKQHSKENSLRHYNHHHKIRVTLASPQSHLVEQRFTIEVRPIPLPNSLFLETFITGQTAVVLPIPCRELQVEQSQMEIQLTPTRAILRVPSLGPSQERKIQFSLMKTVGQGGEKTIFQNMQLYFRGSVQQKVENKLWEEQDILIRVPLSEIIRKEVEVGYVVESLRVESKHVDLQVKEKEEFKYSTLVGFSRRENQILVRAKVTGNALGKQIYPVEISDQCGEVIYRVSVTNSVEFPTLTTHQITNVSIPLHPHDHFQPFAYQNSTTSTLTFTPKSLRPQLLRIKEREVVLKSREQCQLELQFNWDRIRQELEETGRQEYQVLMGMVSRGVMDYFLFRVSGVK